MADSVVLVKVGNSSVRGNLSVDMTTLALVHVDFRLKGFDFLCLDLEKLSDLHLLFLHGLLLVIIVINEDLLDGVIELLVKLNLLLTELTNQVKQVSIVLHFTGQLTLSSIEFSICFFDSLDAALLCLLELGLEVNDYWRWSTDLKVIKIDQVTESKHLLLVVLTLSDLSLLFVLLDLLLLVGFFLYVFLLLSMLVLTLFVKNTLPVDQLKDLSSGEQNGRLEILTKLVTSPVLFVSEVLSLSHEELWIFVHVFVLLVLEDLHLVSNLFFLEGVPHVLGLIVSNKVLHLLNLEDYRHLKFVKFTHLLGLEVLDFFFGLFKLLLDVVLFGLKLLTLSLEFLNVESNLLLVFKQVKSLFSELLDLFDLVLLL